VELCAGWLARAVEVFGVELYGSVFMGNHFHLTAVFPDGNMPGFMGYLKGHLAQAINALWGRTGAVFERRYSAEPILDDAAVIGRWLYMATNPTAAGLVAQSASWNGFSTLSMSLGDQVGHFSLIDRTAFHEALQTVKPNAPVCPEDFRRAHTLLLARLPGCEHLDADAYRAYLLDLVRTRDREIACERAAQGLGFLSRRRLDATRHFDRPQSTARSQRPACHTTSSRLRELYCAGYAALVAAYRVASSLFRAGDRTVEFPSGTYPPPLLSPPDPSPT
jgi:hypothetical protein